jgi:Dephospho-CoA kinase
MYKIIGLTGGIASGKTTVSDYLKKRGYVVLDADAYSKKQQRKTVRRFLQLSKLSERIL